MGTELKLVIMSLQCWCLTGCCLIKTQCKIRQDHLVMLGSLNTCNSSQISLWKAEISPWRTGVMHSQHVDSDFTAARQLSCVLRIKLTSYFILFYSILLYFVLSMLKKNPLNLRLPTVSCAVYQRLIREPDSQLPVSHLRMFVSSCLLFTFCLSRELVTWPAVSQSQAGQALSFLIWKEAKKGLKQRMNEKYATHDCVVFYMMDQSRIKLKAKWSKPGAYNMIKLF